MFARFSAIRITPITRAEEIEPTRIAYCWNLGVAPTRYPVFRSCEVVPPLDEAMQTMAAIDRAINWCVGLDPIEHEEDQAGQQQRGHRHAGDRIGRGADLARQPRRDRHEEEAEEHDQHRRHQVDHQRRPHAQLPEGAEAERGPDQEHQQQRSDADDAEREVAVGALAAGRPERSVWRRSRMADGERAEDQRQGPKEADDAARGHGPRADVQHVFLIDLVFAHLADRVPWRGTAARSARCRRSGSPE